MVLPFRLSIVRRHLRKRMTMNMIKLCLALAFSTGAVGWAQQPLSLQNFLDRVDRNYPKLIGERLQRSSANAKVQEKRGAFDPVFTYSTDSMRYNSGSTPGKALEFTTNEASVEIALPSGLKLYAGSRLNYGMVKSPFSSTGSFGEYFIGAKIPLLRGLRVNEKNVALQQAYINQPIATEGIRTFRLELLEKASSIYWDWVTTGQRLEVARNLLKAAQVRSELIQKQFARGDATRQLSEEAKQEVERRQGGRLKAERDFVKVGFKLNILIWEGDDPTQELPEESLLPQGRDAVRDLAVDSAVIAADRAVSARPELRVLALTREILELDLKLAKNDRMPSLDLALSPGLDVGTRSIGNSWKLGVFFSIALAQNSVDGKIDAAKVNLQTGEQDLKLAKQQIRNEVLDAANTISFAVKRYQAAEREFELAKEVERIELINFREGGGTLFLVNQRERATAEALGRVIETYAEYKQAVAAFQASTTDLLQERN